MTPAESLTEAIDNLAQKKHVISKKALKAKYDLENNMGATVAEKEGSEELDLDMMVTTKDVKKETKKSSNKKKDKKISGVNLSEDHFDIGVNKKEPQEQIKETKKETGIDTNIDSKVDESVINESVQNTRTEMPDPSELERDVKINNLSGQNQSVVVDKKELLLREFNKNIHLLIAVFQRSKFDEVTWFLSRPGRMLFLNFFIGVIRGTGFILGVLTILTLLAAMATSSSEAFTFFQQQMNLFSRLMF